MLFEIAQNECNKIYINQTSFQIEKGIKLYINNIDIKKEHLIFVKYNFCGLSINITFSGSYCYESQTCKVKISPKTKLLKFINNEYAKLTLKQGEKIQNIIINIENEILLKHLSNETYENLKFLQTITSASHQFNAKEIFLSKITNTFFIKSRVYEIISNELKFLNEFSCKKPINLNKDDIKALNYAMQILKQNFKNPPTIQALSRKIFINETKLKLGFKQLFGKSVHESSTHFRMQEAIKLINQQELNLAQISKELGYKQQHNFTRAFKNYFGFNPSKANFDRAF